MVNNLFIRSAKRFKLSLYFIFKIWVFVYIFIQNSPVKGEQYSLKTATTIEPSLKSKYLETILTIGHWLKTSGSIVQ